ncbi:MAG: DUF3987 domain-containing protein [Betaproteobacteria bacterium]
MPLTRDLPPASPFPEAAMGTIGSEAVALMQRIIQAPSALVGQSVLAAINQVSQPYGNVCIDGRVSPLSEYFLTLGESGERKSAVDGWALAGVREHQKSLMAQYEQDRDAFEKALEVYETTSRRILADKKTQPRSEASAAARAAKAQGTGHAALDRLGAQQRGHSAATYHRRAVDRPGQ